MAFENLCLYCFEDMEGQTICPHCGRNSKADVPVLQMLPGSRIYHNRFLIGRALGQDSTGIVYAAFDTKKKNKMRIWEYFPYDRAKRLKGGTVVPIPGEEDVYEAGRQKLQHSIENEEDTRKRHYYFEENGTAYVVQRKTTVQNRSAKKQIDIPQIRGTRSVQRCFSCGRPIIDDSEPCPFCKSTANEEAFWDSVLASLEKADSSVDSGESTTTSQAKGKNNKRGTRCAVCGKVNEADALFCAYCGDVLFPDEDNSASEKAEKDQIEEINDQKYVDLDGVDDYPEDSCEDLLPIEEILKYHFREGDPDENDEASSDFYGASDEDAVPKIEVSEYSIEDERTTGIKYQEDDRDKIAPTLINALHRQDDMSKPIERDDNATSSLSKAIGASVYRLSLEDKRFQSRCVKCGRNMAGNRCRCGFSLTSSKVIFLSPPSGHYF